jgi:8-oxo-dGTP pyrophosphatase MutT (NUDIX family)
VDHLENHVQTANLAATEKDCNKTLQAALQILKHPRPLNHSLPPPHLAPVTDAPWTTLDSRTIVKDRWIHLRSERLRSAAGEELAPWYVLDYPDWVVAVVLTPDDHIVLVRQWRHAARAWSLELPGGVMDAADADPIRTGQRETLEETGYAADAWRYCAAGWANPAIQTNRLHVVVGTEARLVQQPRHEAGETIQVECMPVAALLRALTQGGIGQSMHVGAILLGLAATRRISL